MTPADVVRMFFERMQARDWGAAGAFLSPTICIRYTETGEQFDGPNFLAMNEAYPEGWSIQVVETIAQRDRVATQVRVEHGDVVYWCSGFYTVTDERISEGTEHWVAEGSAPPPSWREPFRTALSPPEAI